MSAWSTKGTSWYHGSLVMVNGRRCSTLPSCSTTTRYAFLQVRGLQPHQQREFIAQVGVAVVFHRFHGQVGPHGGIAQGHRIDGNGKAQPFLHGVPAAVLDAVAIDDHRAEVRASEPVTHFAEQASDVRQPIVLRVVEPFAHPFPAGEGARVGLPPSLSARSARASS